MQEIQLQKRSGQKLISLERKGLFRMALAEVSLIFWNKQQKKKITTRVIKPFYYELKYNAYLEEDDYVLGIYKLDELVAKAPSPSKEILHSLIAEVYWGYYSSNSWKFADRTNVVDLISKEHTNLGSLNELQKNPLSLSHVSYKS